MLQARAVAGDIGELDEIIFRSVHHVDLQRYTVAAAYLHSHSDPRLRMIRDLASAMGCALHQIETRGTFDLSAVRDVLALVRQLQPTIWHAHDCKSDVLGLLLCRFWPMKLVTTVHGLAHETPRTGLYARIDDLTLPRYDHVIAVSRDLEDHCRKIGVADHKLTYVPSAIDAATLRRCCEPVMAKVRLGIVPRCFVLGCVGHLSKEQGVGRAIRTLARLREDMPELMLHVVGDGTDRRRLETMARQLKLVDRIRFWGWQADLRPWYEAMDLLLVPRRSEGLSNEVLEAMAMEVPVAATDVGGVADLLDRGRCGTLLSQDETTWPAVLRSLIGDSAVRRAHAAAARRRVESLYTHESRFARIMSIYDRLLRLPRDMGSRLAA